jgi:hypothetical protein
MLGMLGLPIPSNYGFGYFGHREATSNTHLPSKGAQEQGQRLPEGKCEHSPG